MATYYATAQEIGAKFFNGESIPSENTINKSRYDFICDQSQKSVNDEIGVTEDQTDVNGLLRRAFLEFFGKELRGQKLVLDSNSAEALKKQFGSAIAFVGLL